MRLLSRRRLPALFRPTLLTLEDRTVPSGMPASWSTRGAGGGGALFSPSINPTAPNELFVSSDMGELFRSTDTGASWQQVDFRQLRGNHETRVQFTEVSGLVYTIDYTNETPHVERSTDGGRTWQPLANDPTGGEAYYLAVNPSNYRHLVVTDYSRLFVSLDGGQTWAQKHNAANNGAGIVLGGAFWDGATLYLGTNDGLLRSIDGGQSFAVVPLSGVPSGQVIRSFAGGKSNGVTRFVAITASAGDTYAGVQGYDNGGGTAALTLDVGASGWVNRPLPGGAWPYFAGMAQTDANTLYVAGGSSAGTPTVYKSSNGGASWADVLRTTNNANIQTGWSGQGGDRGWWYGETAMGFAVSPTDPNRLLITDYGFAHGSADGGVTWQNLNVAPADRNPAGANTPTGKAYHDSGLDNTTSWGVTWANPNNLFIANSDVRGQRSTDGGQTFGFGYTGHTLNSMYRAVRHPNGKMYSGTGSVHDLYQSTYLTDSRIDGGTGQVMVSNDNGASWQVVRDFGDVVSWVHLDPANPERLYASVVNRTAGGIYVTNNLSAGASATWTRLASPPRTEGHPFNILTLTDGTLVVSYSGRRDASGAFTPSSGVFASTDGGLTWQDRSAPGMRYWTKDVVVDPHDPTQNTWYAGVFSGWGGAPNNTGGLYKSTDRGQTWTRLLGGLDRVTSITFNPADSSEAFITTETQGLWYSNLMRSANPSFIQVQSYPFAQPERVFFNPYNANEIWVTSFGGGVMVGSTPTPDPGTLQLGTAAYTVGEGAGTLTLTVTRSGGSAGAVTVSFATTNGTALAPGDYTVANGTLTWATGDTTPKTITVAVIDDALVEGNETFTVTLSAPTGGSTLGTPTSSTVTLTDNDVPPPPPPSSSQPFAVGTDSGVQATVRMFNPDGTVRFTATPFGSYTGGVRVATGDVTGDGVPDLVAGTNGGVQASVKIVDGATGQVRPGELSAGSWYSGPASVAAGDVTGDEIADIVIATNNAAKVFVYRGGDFALLRSFAAGPATNFWGGAQVALSDLTGDGRADLIVTGRYATGIRVVGFDGRSLNPEVKPLPIFRPFVLSGSGFEDAPYLAAGDVNADGRADLILGSGEWSTSRVLVLSGRELMASGRRLVLADFAPPGTAYGFGVRVAARDVDGDGRADLLAGAGPGRGSKVQVYLGRGLTRSGVPPTALDFDAVPGFTGGVFVG